MESVIRQRIKKTNIVDKYSLLCDIPKNMLLELTNICNDSCLFCANSKCTKKRGIIAPKLAKSILKEAYEAGVREVGFYGTGEPLIDSNLEEYIAFAKHLGYEYIYITTNGALLTKERADEIVRAGIDSIKLSINAANKEDYALIHGKDEFDQVIKNLIYLHSLKKENKKKFAIYISYVVTRYSEKDKDKFKDQYDKYVDDILFYDCLNISGSMSREVTNYLSIDTKRKNDSANICSMIFNNLYITYEGYLTMCCSDFQNYLVIADLKKDKLVDAWNNTYAQELRKKHIEYRLEGTICENCINNCINSAKPLREEYAEHVDIQTWDKSGEIISRINKYKNI